MNQAQRKQGDDQQYAQGAADPRAEDAPARRGIVDNGRAGHGAAAYRKGRRLGNVRLETAVVSVERLERR